MIGKSWLLFSILALLCWSGSDLFSKIGCGCEEDRLSHLKMLMAVGTVMGLHAAWELLFNGAEINGEIILEYLPVSCLYILSMAIGYLGLRYIELSISSPICNSSGAIVAALTIGVYGISEEIPAISLAAVGLVCIGVAGLGITEAREDEELRQKRQSERQYSKSLIAILIPVIYCLLDALGTFADSVVLETMDENSANAAYELTFFAVGIMCGLYVIGVKKQKLSFKQELPKYTAAAFETAGQFFYINALSDSAHVALSAPVISSYCVASVLWSRLFLKEKLSGKHYACIAIVVLGIIILGVLDI